MVVFFPIGNVTSLPLLCDLAYLSLHLGPCLANLDPARVWIGSPHWFGSSTLKILGLNRHHFFPSTSTRFN